MTDRMEDDGDPVGTCDEIIHDFEQVLGADQSDDSQTVGLKTLSIESVDEGASESPPPQEGGNSQKSKKKSKNKKKASESQRATTPSGLQGSPSPSAGLASMGSNQSTPTLTSTPTGTRKDPILVSDGGGSTSTELYANEVSDISQDENPTDTNNNNNDKETDTKTGSTGVTREGQSSSDSSPTLVDPSSPGRLDPADPESLGDLSADHATSGRSASGQSTSGRSASGQSNSGRSASGQSASGRSASGQSASGRSASGQPSSGLVADDGTAVGNNTVFGTATGVPAGVQGVPPTAPQPLPESVRHEADMDTDPESAMSTDDTGSGKPGPDLMEQAALMVSKLIDRIMSGQEAAIVLPQADPVISLVQEIAEKAQFPLSERIPQEEGMVELVHVRTGGSWSDLPATSSCDDLSKSSWSQPPDTDEDARVLEVLVVDGDVNPQSAQQDARPSLEDVMASARPRSEPSHPYRPP